MQNLPILEMVAQSDVMTAVILVILGIMSLGCWGIILVKLLTNGKHQRANAKFFAQFRKMEHFVDLITLCEKSSDSALKRLTLEVLQEASKFSNYVSRGESCYLQRK